MNKLFIVNVLLILSFHLIKAQDRVNKQENTFTIIAKSDTIKNALFWTYNEKSGKWSNKKNDNISSEQRYNDKQNFTYLLSSKLEDINGDIYYKIKCNPSYFFKLSLEGYVELNDGNPSFRRKGSQISSIILTAKQYDKLKSNILNCTGKTLKLESSIYPYGSTNKSSEIKYYAYFKATISNDLKVVRFRLPEVNNYNKKIFENNYFEMPIAEFKKLLF